MLLRIAIIEDEPFFQEKLKAQLLSWESRTGNRVNILTYNTGTNFLMTWYDNLQFDGIFLDIRMPNEDGIQIAKTIRNTNKDIPIVFVTSITEKVFQGYDVQALHYLVKPPKSKDVDKCLDKILCISRNQESDCYVSRSEGSWIRIPLHEIIYLESFSHYIEICTLDNSYRIRKNISQILEELPQQFIRCYRSYIVNIRHVSIIRPKEVLLSNQKIIPLSQTYVKDINRQFIKYHDL